MMIRLLVLCALPMSAQLAFAKDSYKYDWKIESVPTCDTVSTPHKATVGGDDFLKVGDEIKTWRFLLWRGLKIARVDGRPDWKFKIRNSDRKDIFATVKLPAHGDSQAAAGVKEEHCAAVEYAGYDSTKNQHFVDFFLIGMNPGDTCDGQLLDEATKEDLRPSSACNAGHNGSARGFSY